MTIESNDRRKQYQGNGEAVRFNGPRAFAASHVQVFVRPFRGKYVLVPGSQYTLSGIGGQQTQVVFDKAPVANSDVLILRTVPFDQDTDITNQGAFLPELHENAFDKRVMQIQQLADSTMQLVLEDGDFVWDAQGNRIANVGDALKLADAVNLQMLLKYLEDVGSGGLGVEPLFWDWVGDGVTRDIPIPGAEIDNALLYDTAQEVTAGKGDYIVLKPDEDFTLVVDEDVNLSLLRFKVAPKAGVKGFTTLRGYARPYNGERPLTTVASRIINNVVEDTLVDGSFHNSLLVVDAPVDVSVIIRANTGAGNDWKAGEFFSVLQKGRGKVNIKVEAGGGLIPSPGFIGQTRGQGSIISSTCIGGDIWPVSGDLLREVVAPSLQCFALEDRSVLMGSNITLGAGKASFMMPYGFMLSPVNEGGVYASLAVAQDSGVPVMVDIKREGTSIFSTKLSIDNQEKSSLQAATSAVYASKGNILYAGDELSVDVTQLGAAGAKGLTIYLVGQRIS